MAVNYLNLTSGLEWASQLENYQLVRIQSSHFESGKMWSAVRDTDYAFLINAATHGVILHDCGSRRGAETRVVWKGVPWIMWCYAKANGGELPSAMVNGYNAAAEFEHFYAFGESSDTSKKAKAKLRYVGKLTGRSTLRIQTRSKISTLDGQIVALAQSANIIS